MYRDLFESNPYGIPGRWEQGESRLFRPDVENKYPMPMEDDGDGNKRAVKYVDWINASRTIDVTKNRSPYRSNDSESKMG